MALEPKRVSVDIVVEENDLTYFWEFHEKQHKKLTVDRPTPVYNKTGREYKIPRYLQRLIRDVWRIKALGNLTVVWSHWFALKRQIYEPELQNGFNEYALDGNFTFGKFLG